MRNILLLFLTLLVNLSWANDCKILPYTPYDKVAIEYDYFPSRLHAFVFRNWTSVPAKRLAKVVGATSSQINEIASEMGLPKQKNISPIWESPKGYITVLRRNWHLLDYPQLLTLLNVDAKTLRARLREDDFLFEKLGTLKPICPELKYTPSNELEKQKAKKLANLLQKYGIENIFSEAPKFSFIKDFATAKKSEVKQKDDGSIRIAFSYFSDYGDPLMTNTSYPDGLLEELANKGVNGIWLHVVLNTLVESNGIFEGSDKAPERIKNLNKLIERAEKYGIKVWLYFNEPRAMPDSFFESSKERMAIRGTRYASLNVSSMCTSKEEVLKWLSDSVENVFKQAPKLGGVFTITASENPTSCMGRMHSISEFCPVCKKKGCAEIISLVNNTICRAIKRASPSAELIAYDWNWKDDDYKHIVSKLDKDIILMTVSEVGSKINRGGVKSQINEYSLSVVGPSERSIERWKYAKNLGLRTMAKVQTNLSWEFSAAPELPVLNIAAKHTKRLRENGVNNFLLTWSLGGYPSANMEIFNKYDTSKSDTENISLIAKKYYGDSSAEKVIQAWKCFSEAFEEYPFNITTAYFGPHNVGVANPLYAKKTNYGATMVGFPYDDIYLWSSIYPITSYISQMRKLDVGFTNGMKILNTVDTSTMTDSQKKTFENMHNWSNTARIHFSSSANQTEIILLRDKKNPDKAKLLELINKEETLAKEQLAIVMKDSHIGFESSNHYFYTAIDIYEKFISLDFFKNYHKLAEK